jgi:Mn-dependent DtxR family transcriptional regulator
MKSRSNSNISIHPILIEKLDEFLGFPTTDPHGEPIPDYNGNVKAYSTTTSQ